MQTKNSQVSDCSEVSANKDQVPLGTKWINCYFYFLIHNLSIFSGLDFSLCNEM